MLAAQVATLSVLLPLLAEVACPPDGVPVTPLLRDMACRLVTAMPASPAAAAFRTALSGLPTATKARLQAALRGCCGWGRVWYIDKRRFCHCRIPASCDPAQNQFCSPPKVVTVVCVYDT
jgi:hypothetical protein